MGTEMSSVIAHPGLQNEEKPVMAMRDEIRMQRVGNEVLIQLEVVPERMALDGRALEPQRLLARSLAHLFFSIEFEFFDDERADIVNL